MRWAIAGLLILILPTLAFAQAKGQVLSIGFNNHYRPDCWTPMLVQLTSDSDESTDYQIQVVQEDLDRDRVIFTQEVTLGGNVEGRGATTENFWVYFKPKPTGQGLPDANDLATNLETLNNELKVFLCDKNGKQLSTLPITSTILSVDPVRGIADTTRSRKLILFVTDGIDKPIIPNYSQQAGVLEDVDAVGVQPRDLPASVLGYDAVDAIVWLDADANFLISGTRTPSLEAIRQWVAQGGHLIVAQPPDPLKIKPFADLLPVAAILQNQSTIPMADHSGLDVLTRIVGPDVASHWPKNLPPFKIARVPARQDAKVDEWIAWPDNIYTPWLARRPDGLGAVTWVAQDLGNPSLTSSITTGWRFIWDRVLGWNNPAIPEDYHPPDSGDDPWKVAPGIDLGWNLLQGMDFTKTAALFVGVSVVFFIVYWLAAGLGSYFFLASRGRASLSWYFFAASALAATLLTVLLVKLLVRGAPEVRHLSDVRYAAGEPDAVIDSRFGLYIPQDGLKQIDLRETDPHQLSTLTPFGIHPQYLHADDILPAYLQYEVPVTDTSDSDTVSISIPYRSTSKKLQAHWVGPPKALIDVPSGMPDVKIVPPGNGGYLDGTLINNTGYDLTKVYLAFQETPYIGSDQLSSRDVTMLIYLPTWLKDAPLNLKDLTPISNYINLFSDTGRKPGGDKPAFAPIDPDHWDAYWQANQESFNDHLDLVLPMLAFFDRLTPWQANKDPRAELYRRGGREFDLSPALTAGRLVICGLETIGDDPTKTPLPMPLYVSDSLIPGQGTTIVEFVLPLDRSAVSAPPTTQPQPP
jgi:hypothetical protein